MVLTLSVGSRGQLLYLELVLFQPLGEGTGLIPVDTPGEDISYVPSCLTWVFFFSKGKKNSFSLGKEVSTQGVKEGRKGTKKIQIFFTARSYNKSSLVV